MDGYSFDVLAEKLNSLKETIPEAFSEDKIDWEKLKVLLGSEVNLSQERYHLNWAGKSEVFRVLQQRTSATLIPDRENSVDFDSSENVFIEGENLEVLKVLQKSYFSKIKMIYIDPPYNTGNDSFIYPDSFAETKEEYLKRIGDKDEEGYLLKEGMFRKNSKDNGHYHSNWLSMMYPRLYLARNLLRDDGVIFVSIDDNEVHNLRLIMNEIFGEENFVASIIWQSKTGSSDAKTIDITTEYILVFAKSIEEASFNKNYGGYNISRYKYKDEFFENRGPYYYDTLDRGGLRYSDSLNFGVECPDGTFVYPNGRTEYKNDGWTYKWSKEKIEWGLANRFIEIKKQKNGQSNWKVYYKVYLNVDNEDNRTERGTTIKNLITDIKTGKSTNELNSLFDFNVFKYSKPYELISDFCKMIDTENSIIMDFFAGSGTTAQAILALNKEDGGNRKFLMIQLPEETNEKSEAYKAGYTTIASICRERIKRVISKLKNEPKDDSFFKEEVKQDFGLKSYKLVPSNFKVWRNDAIENAADLNKMVDLFNNKVKAGTETENILYELMLKSGYSLTEKVVQENGFYKIAGSETIIVIEKVDNKTTEAILAAKPKNVIILDKLFGNDQLKTNLALQLKDANIKFMTV